MQASAASPSILQLRKSTNPVYSILASTLFPLQNYDVMSRVEVGQMCNLGGFSDVFSGRMLPIAFGANTERYNARPMRVAIKRFRIMLKPEGDPAVAKQASRIARELKIWACLQKHRNILPFLGFMLHEGLLCSVSEWMENGNMRQYLASHPNTDRLTLAKGVASGLRYLHSEDIIHSDLKSENIVINPGGHPMLCDFGISRALLESGSRSNSFKGSLRWMAIELLFPGNIGTEKNPRHSKATDVWAYGMVVYELLTGKLPFYSCTTDPLVILSIAEGKLPEKPAIGDRCDIYFEELWSVCTRCWESDPKNRPTMDGLTNEMGRQVGLSHIRSFEAHPEWVTHVAFSPVDTHTFATSSTDRTIRIWTLSPHGITLRQDRCFVGHTADINIFEWSPDGLSLVSCSDDRTVRKWDMSSGEEVFATALSHSQPILSVAHSPDNERIASGGLDRHIYIWDAVSGDKIAGPLTGHIDGVAAIVYSPDGRKFVSGSWDGSVIIWDSGIGVKISGPFRAHSSGIRTICYHPAGLNFVVGSDDNTISVWSSSTFRPIHNGLRAHRQWISSVGYSPDGRLIITVSCDRTMRLWDAEIGKVVSGPVGSVQDENIRHWTAGFSQNGIWVASGDIDGTVHIWAVSVLN